MPGPGTDFEISARELNAAATDHVIKAIVVFKSIGANDVIVVRVLQTKDQPSCLINASGHRLEFHADVQVAK